MLSFITVAKDNGKNVKRLIDSLKKSARNVKYEYIVVDTGNKEIPIFDDDVRLIPVSSMLHKEDGFGRNVGAKFASNDWYVFVDSNAFVVSNTIPTILELIKKFGADYVFTGSTKITGPQGNSIKQISSSDKIHVISKKVFEELNGYEDVVGDSTEKDWSLFLERVKKAGFNVKEHYGIACLVDEYEPVVFPMESSPMKDGYRMINDIDFQIDVQKYRKIAGSNAERVANLESSLAAAQSVVDETNRIKEDAQKAVENAKSFQTAAAKQLERKYADGFDAGVAAMEPKIKDVKEEANKMIESEKRSKEEIRKELAKAQARVNELTDALRKLGIQTDEATGRIKELESSLASLTAKKKSWFKGFGK